MERLYEIGDIVYSKKEGPNSQFEVMEVYPLKTEERHFLLRRINNYDPFDMNPNPQGGRIYSTEYFKPMYWFVCRKVIFEKCLKK